MYLFRKDGKFWMAEEINLLLYPPSITEVEFELY